MAGLKEIKTRIKSVTNTKKITYAMKLVSAAKLGKAQDAVKRSKDYIDGIKGLLSQVLASQSSEGFSHPLAEVRDNPKKARVIVIGANRGLCGAYNTRVNQGIASFISESKKSKIETELVILGKKPAEFCRAEGIKYQVSYEELSDEPASWPLEQVCVEAEDDFLQGKIDALYVIYTNFKSALSQNVVTDQLLPLSANDFQSQSEGNNSGSTLFEPSIQQVFMELLPRIMRTRVRQASQNAKASEHGSRMAAMDNATKNAGDLMESLTLTHNKLRQTGITNQILDIVGGAEAAK